MPVQIPRVDRFGAQAPGQSDRLEMNAPNLLGATTQLREGLSNVVNTSVDVIDARQKELRKKELEVKDLKATEAAIKYEQTLKTDLDRLKQLKGDTTPAYKQFDEKRFEFEDTIYTEVGEDPETRQLLQQKIISANGRITDLRSTQQTAQYYSWQKEVADNSVKLKQDNAMKDSQFLDIRNPVAFGRVDKALSEIEGTRRAIAIQNGYDIKPITNPKTGAVTGWDYSNAPAIETQIKADIGDAIIPIVKSLNGAGKVKEAKALIESKKPWLNAEDVAKLTADNDEASVKNRALEGLSKLGPNPSIDQINALKDVGEDVKLKMREINHTNSLHREREVKQKADTTYLKMINEIEAAGQTAVPYVSVDDFKERSKLYKNNRDLLTVSQRSSLEKYFDQNRETDPDTMVEIYNLFRNNDLDKLTGAQIMEMRSKLSVRDEGRFQTMLTASQKPTSEASKNVLTNSAMDRVDRSFTRLTYADGSPMFKKKQNGKYSKADNEQLTEVLKAVEDNIRNNPRWTQQAEDALISQKLQEIKQAKQQERDSSLTERVRGFFRGIMGETTPKQPNPFKGGAPAPAPVQTTPTKPQAKAQPGQAASSNDMSKWTNAQWIEDYQSKNGGKMPPPSEMRAVLKTYKEKRMNGEIK